MTPEEIKIRRPVWIAMANLYLDTDVRLWYALIAQELAESPFSLEQLEAILSDEVGWVIAPVFPQIKGIDFRGRIGHRNSATGSDEMDASLIEACLERTNRLLSETPEPHWSSVAILIVSLRKLERAERARRVRTWGILARIFLDRDPILPTLELTREELDLIWRDDMWPAYGPSAGVRGSPSKDEIELAWNSFKSK